jgi:hypothetical protein
MGFASKMTELQQRYKSAPRGVKIALAACPLALIMTSGIAVALQSPTKPPVGLASQIVAKAKSGNKIILPPLVNGETLNITNRKFSPAIKIDVSQISLEGIVIRNSSGIILNGGKINGPGGRSYGINVVGSNNVRIQRMSISGAHRGIVISKSQDVAVEGNLLTGLIAEGVNIAQSHRVLISGNTCSDFNPTMGSWSADGKRIEDGDHPDCIQAWSRPDSAPTSDVRVVNNEMQGFMQGIFFGNHVRDGVDDGGFDRIEISNNRVHISLPNGISLYSARNSKVVNNKISTVPGARSQRPPHNPVKASLRVIDTVATEACGNTVEGVTKAQFGTEACGR